MIDVLEHIVEHEKLTSALRHIRRALTPGGVYLVAVPLRQRPRQRFFYLRFWSKEDIASHFSGWYVSPELPFRGGQIFAIRCPVFRTESSAVL